MRVYYTDRFVLPLPAGHKFPMAKYAGVRERLESSRCVPASSLLEPPAATDAQLARAHDPEYLGRVVRGELTAAEVRRIGFPWSPQMVERSRRSAGATIEAARAALEDGVGVSLAGGTHHAFRDRGEGFCVFNDAVVAARTLQDDGRIARVVVIDLDVHQGNGTAALCAGDPTIFAFSIHGEKNFPYRKETGDLDVALPDGTGDADYLAALARHLPEALDRARADLAIYLAGADPWEGDRWGRMALTKEGLRGRDRFVFDSLRRRRIPVAVTMSGGYAPDVADTIEIHVETVAEALRAAKAWSARGIEVGRGAAREEAAWPS